MEKKKKLLSLLMVFTILLMLGAMVMAESYTSTLTVNSSYEGVGRYYSGTTISCYCYNTIINTIFGTRTDTLTIRCRKRGFLGIYYDIGTDVQGTVYSNSYSTVGGSWTISSNYYKFQFIKGTWWGLQESIDSNDVEMYSN